MSGGEIATAGNGAAAVYARIQNVDNTEDATATISGGDIVTNGSGGFGAVARHDGPGNAIATFDVATYSSSGRNADGVRTHVSNALSEGDAISTINGIENVVGGSGMDTLTGDGANNNLQGLSGNDTIFGGGGNDAIRGDEGDDTINGGTGNDFVTGSEGDDTFVFSLGSGADVLTDFTAGAGTDDVIDISAYGFADLAAVQAASVDSGANMIIDLDGLPGGDQLTLWNVNISDLDVSDFTL